MAVKDSSELNLRDMVERVWRHRDSIILFQAVIVVLTLFVILFWPRSFASEAQLFLQRGRESVGLDPTTSTGPSIGVQQSGRDGEIKTAIEVLSSRGVIEPVVRRLGPGIVLGKEPLSEESSRQRNAVALAISRNIGWAIEQVRKIDPASDFERAVVQIERNLTIHAERKAEVIRVFYEADSPELAQHVVKAIVDEYTQMHPQLHATDGSTEFFEDQNRRLRSEFEDASNRLSREKTRTGLVSIPEQTRILEDQLGQIRSDMLATEKSLSRSRARGEDLLTQLRTVPDRVPTEEVSKPNHATELQSQSLFDLQIRMSEAEARYRPSHPKYQELKQAYEKAKIHFDEQMDNREERTFDVNPVHEQLMVAYTQNKSDLAGLVAAREELANQEKEVLAAIGKLNKDSIAIRLLEVEAKTAETKLVTYGANLEDARANRERQLASMSSVKVAQPATLQEKPISPSKPLAALVGIMICGAGSLLIALLSIQADDTLISSHALTAGVPEVPVLGTLPRSRSFGKVLA